MPRKKQDPLDQKMNITCHNCYGEIEVVIRQIKKDFQPICPACGTPYDSKKSGDRIRKEVEPLIKRMDEVIEKNRRQRRGKD